MRSESFIKSVKNKKWAKRSCDKQILDSLDSLDINLVIKELLAGRGVNCKEVSKYLSPKIKDYLPDPLHLKDMRKAVEFLTEAIKLKRKIAVFGDYDVDGATSSAQLKKFFQMLGHDILIYIPDRIREGYGPNIEALKYLKSEGVEVVITVDCGAVAYEALAEASAMDLNVVVVDHHIGGDDLPEAIAVVNPNRVDETSEYGYLCAAGVVFLLIIALNKHLREKGINHASNQEILQLLDLVALGTVCDVVPIKGLNRAFIAQGLKLITRANNTGVKALKQISGMSDEAEAYHLGFVLGPRINAGGRVGDASIGARLLSSNDFNQAIALSRELDMHNHERKLIESKILDDAVREASYDKESSVAFIVGHEWHLGVIGIVAGRLKETLNKPSIVITVTEGIGKASCRSVPGIDIGSVIHKALQKGLLEAGGGHAMAAGFSVDSSKITDLKLFIENEITDDYQNFIAKDCEYYDCELSPTAINTSLISEVANVGPYGAENPQPKFYLKNINISNAKIVGSDHVSCFVSNNTDNSYIKAISFRAINGPVGEILLRNHKNIDIICNLSLNKWNGSVNPEINILDVIVG